ncbi:glycine zipper 2TM domain-containing protein [Duganella sp. FT135W]|uniref:Glycine zipper 2TM domain-containing protein n=1 Tax=Duganella flavida TaxID=2692175 RepID=A0A6L8KIP9_9BURK|nr:glycine zipper 2TM domain-containing protein [Duganella flavida]MYM25622.1 glycine zipper 2TM domain-containing protein [Duganella flavida]
MERTRIHPMMAVAAASVTLVSLVGAASIAGLLPDSKATTAPAAMPTPLVASAAPVNAPVLAPEPRRVVEHRTVVHHTAAPQPQVVQTQAPAPAPAPQNSVVGIGLGAVVGGLLGNQVGSGNGRKLATIAGAVGGGYVGNEIAKRNQQ